MATHADEPRTIGPVRRRTLFGILTLLILIVVAFAAQRFLDDIPEVLEGTVPDDDYAIRYVEHFWPAYLHFVPGIVYLVLAPFQLSHRFRSRHYTLHRWTGRVLLSLALVSGVFAFVFGVPHAFGGRPESIATVVFGTWFLTCLVLAFRAIRRDDVFHHRRWMIRAFSMGVAVGTIRIWIPILMPFLGFQGAFGPAFWLAFSLHVAAAEWWIRTTPPPTDARSLDGS